MTGWIEDDSLGRVTCLIVDDVDENLLVLSALLEPLHVEILTARSGAEALDLLLSHEVALVLLDVHMPEMDGFELAELMRGAERTRNIPLIFVTAGGREVQRMFKGYDLGAVDFLYKPIEAHVLLSKAKVFFELHRQKLRIADELRRRTETLRLNEMFGAVLGHDLRAPLDVMATASRLLDDVADDPASVRRVAGQIRNSSRRMSRLIDDMLDLARGRLGGGIPVAPQAIALDDVVQRVLEEYRAGQPDVRLDLAATGDLRCEADPDRFSQVVSNLVGNAIAHGQRRAPIEVRLDGSDPDFVSMLVRNQGEIAAEALPHLFEAFAVAAGRPRGPGLGLGLYIAQQIVHGHGGTIDARSGDGCTTIDVRLPRAGRRRTATGPRQPAAT
jgi:two-component system sensor histidine kinase/response regulator